MLRDKNRGSASERADDERTDDSDERTDDGDERTDDKRYDSSELASHSDDSSLYGKSGRVVIMEFRTGSLANSYPKKCVKPRVLKGKNSYPQKCFKQRVIKGRQGSCWKYWVVITTPVKRGYLPYFRRQGSCWKYWVVITTPVKRGYLLHIMRQGSCWKYWVALTTP
jgi:hypothetical protein